MEDRARSWLLGVLASRARGGGGRVERRPGRTTCVDERTLLRRGTRVDDEFNR